MMRALGVGVFILLVLVVAAGSSVAHGQETETPTPAPTLGPLCVDRYGTELFTEVDCMPIYAQAIAQDASNGTVLLFVMAGAVVAVWVGVALSFQVNRQ